jgi:hypothetical protein
MAWRCEHLLVFYDSLKSPNNHCGTERIPLFSGQHHQYHDRDHDLQGRTRAYHDAVMTPVYIYSSATTLVCHLHEALNGHTARHGPLHEAPYLTLKATSKISHTFFNVIEIRLRKGHSAVFVREELVFTIESDR